ncbi:hypothetical protein SKAU_G00151570 [Synaphobranchus kaupii]|uniref:Uncharacterized protein n=1 Tax=Synaphobranchus kaupii TaxID=118154 RepID=A0A9Q1FH70_SYNKA|nr:hypothetical protein SKAU_G00151570 [Synaphobranchus kaupii]
MSGADNNLDDRTCKIEEAVKPLQRETREAQSMYQRPPGGSEDSIDAGVSKAAGRTLPGRGSDTRPCGHVTWVSSASHSYEAQGKQRLYRSDQGSPFVSPERASER